MKGIPPELFYALIFVGVILFQIMKRRREAQAPDGSGESDGEPPVPDERFLDFGKLEQAAPLAWSPPSLPTPASRAASPREANVVAAGSRRRFSRQSLFRNRLDVQNAVVIATILGPCRAAEPPGGAAAPDFSAQSVR